jgi:hypothetical protein
MTVIATAIGGIVMTVIVAAAVAVAAAAAAATVAGQLLCHSFLARS